MRIGRFNLSWGDEPVSSKIRRPLTSSLYDSEQQVQDLDLVMLRKIALRESYFVKGVFKKNMDTLRNWFDIKSVDEDKKVDKTDTKILYDFDLRSDFRHKLFIAGACSNIYGTGFAEPVFKSELKKNIDPSTKPDLDNDEIVNLNIINSECIKEKEPKKVKDETLYWVYQELAPESKKHIHLDRLIPVITDRLPFSDFGISKVHILYNVLKSIMNADVACGEMLAWSSTGMVDVKIQDMDDEQEKMMLDTLKKHPSGYVHDQDYEFQVINPNRIDPKPYYDYLIGKIAAAFNMPVHILLGQQMGDVTGSEVGLSDYYHDVENIQQIVFTPIIEKIYKNILECRGKKWRYYIDWNPIFVDELSEAKIIQTRAYPATQCYDRSIIDKREARMMMNEGVVFLDPEKEIEDKKTKPVNPVDTNPNIEPQPSVKKPTIRSLTEEEKQMIVNLKRLGERELVEQERRLEEAEKKVKRKK